MPSQKNIDEVKILTDKLETASAVYFTDYLGLDVESITNLQPGDQINIPGNMKYRLLGNMSVLQTITAMMTLYLTYQAAVN